MSQQRWDLPIKAIWGAGSSVRIVFRLRITVACAHTFQTFTGNSVTVRSSTKRSLPVSIAPFCCLRLSPLSPPVPQYPHPGEQSASWRNSTTCVGQRLCGGEHDCVDFWGRGWGILHQHPLVRQVMSWAGVAWLSWMSWQLFSAPATNLSENHHRFTARRRCQIVNPKTWMMALAVVSLFARRPGVTHCAILH